MATLRETARMQRVIGRLEFQLSADNLSLSQEYRDKLKVRDGGITITEEI